MGRIPSAWGIGPFSLSRRMVGVSLPGYPCFRSQNMNGKEPKNPGW
jgi:hypothetical protein